MPPHGSQNITVPLFDANQQPVPELRLTLDQVDLGTSGNLTLPREKEYSDAIRRVARAAAAAAGFDRAAISGLIHDSTTGGSSVHQPDDDHITVAMRSSLFPSSNRKYHVYCCVKYDEQTKIRFEYDRQVRNDPQIYPGGYPWDKLVVRNMTPDYDLPVDLYKSMFEKWTEYEDKKAKRKARNRGQSDDWDDNDGATGAAGGEGGSSGWAASSYAYSGGSVI